MVLLGYVTADMRASAALVFAQTERRSSSVSSELRRRRGARSRAESLPFFHLMPRVSAFYGITIWFYRPDHPPPHFHAKYGDDEARIELDTLRVINGHLPRRALSLVRIWARLHHAELRANWERAVRLEERAQMEPLP